MSKSVSSKQVRNAIRDASECTHPSLDEAYRVINFAEQTKVTDKLHDRDYRNLSYQEYLSQYVHDTSIDDDTFNILKEVKLQCFKNYLESDSEPSRSLNIRLCTTVRSSTNESSEIEL
ncbi:hypothetical protein V7S43_000154 [Phytophthora oleae]|uniref:Uncharacterized protein n=1 Tax=Phytophthora oleae TaxID=2107226 RepID=A0ABD3GAL5_9STRA